MPIRGISEKVLYVHNPLPDVSEEELLERAKLEHIEPSNRSPFHVEWKYAGGLDQEWLHIKPGEFVPLRETEIGQFMREFQEQGMVAVENPEDKDEVIEAAKKGLGVAFRYWEDRGAKCLVKYRKRHGLGDEEMEGERYDLYAYHLNQARADAIKDRLNDLRVKVKPSRHSASTRK